MIISWEAPSFCEHGAKKLCLLHSFMALPYLPAGVIAEDGLSDTEQERGEIDFALLE